MILEPIRATVGGTLILHDVPEKPLTRLVDAFQLPNPKYVRARRMGFPTGAEPKTIDAAIEMPGRELHFPRGAIRKVRTVLGHYGYGLGHITDQRATGTRVGPFPFIPLRDYQRAGVTEFVRNVQGTITLPCGGGKTRLGIGAVGALGLSTLILVETGDLAAQWDASLRELLGVVPGWLGQGRAEVNASIVIGILDSVLPYLERHPDYGQRFGLVIEDECHHVSAPSSQRALSMLPARYRLGLTATPYREDGLELLIDWSFGDVLLARTTEDLIRQGFLERGTIERVETSFTFVWPGQDDDPKRIVEMERELCEDLLRNTQIVDRVVLEHDAGETVLVLTGRREHVRELSGWIAERGVPVIGLTSSVRPKKRLEAVRAFRAGELRVLVATSLADEGLDVARLKRVVLAFPNKARASTVQRLGRSLRLCPGASRPLVIDFVDNLVPTLKRRGQERMRAWRKEGVIER